MTKNPAIESLRNIPRSIDVSGFPLTAGAVTMSWGRVLLSAGLSDLQQHDRLHAATSMLSEHLNALELRAVTGHRDLRMPRPYLRPNTPQ
ncbi:MAG: hypothetical protein RLZZ153_593 [Pseudomonadota bacterium]|jgi:hypothetical protein